MNNYMHLLVKQYARCKGLTKVDFNDKVLLKEVKEWLKEMSRMGNTYLNFLDELGINYNKITCAEIGKSGYDTIVNNKKTMIITPETRHIEGVKKERIITADISIDDNKVSFKVSEGRVTIPNRIFSTFMTQNVAPFRVKKWADLHNFGNYNIIVGAYGSTTDKDIYPKLNEIENFRKNLDDSIVYEYNMVNDTYVVVIASKNTVLQKSNIRV